MNSGQPVFSQEAEAPEETPEVEVSKRVEVDPIGARLKFCEQWGEEPCVAAQAKQYPDSVKIVSELYRMFDVSNPTDMEEFSKINLSHRQNAKYRITSDEIVKWNEAKGTMLVVIRVQERMFKNLKSNSHDHNAA